MNKVYITGSSIICALGNNKEESIKKIEQIFQGENENQNRKSNEMKYENINIPSVCENLLYHYYNKKFHHLLLL